MNDLFILHLSDLHIDEKATKLHKDLLNDIKTRVSFIPDGRLVVVITGDTINKGNPKAYENAHTILQKLKDILNKKLKSIYIVPGNHDKYRTPSNAFVVPTYRQLIYSDDSKYPCDNKQIDIFSQRFIDDIWPIHEDSYTKSRYIDLVKSIYEDSPNMQEIEIIAERTYGVHAININNKNYCFILLNTAWSCADDYDIHKLILGDFQLNSISDEYIKKRNQTNFDIVFVLGHHPIEQLYGTERDKLFSRMISYEHLCANVYLCGHVHDRSVINWSNNRHVLHTLVSGFGWPEMPNDRIHDHYYSLYTFHLDCNSMDIIVFNTADDGQFKPDLSIYTGNSSIEKLSRPLKYDETQGKIILSSVKNKLPVTTFATENFLSDGKQLFTCLRTVSIEMGKQIGFIIDELSEVKSFQEIIAKTTYHTDSSSKEETENYRILFRNCLCEPYGNDTLNEEEQRFIDEIRECSTYKNIIYYNFQAFLQRLCLRLRQELTPTDDKNLFCCFEYLLNKTTTCYSTLCSSNSTSVQVTEDIDQLEKDNFGGLQKAAFENNTSNCLLYSANIGNYDIDRKGQWKDFIIVAPDFTKNIYEKQSQRQKNVNPLLTFIILIYDEKYEDLLRCMDYFSISQYISDMLQQFMDTFGIEVDGFLKWIKNKDREDRKGD